MNLTKNDLLILNEQQERAIEKLKKENEELKERIKELETNPGKELADAIREAMK